MCAFWHSPHLCERNKWSQSNARCIFHAEPQKKWMPQRRKSDVKVRRDWNVDWIRILSHKNTQIDCKTLWRSLKWKRWQLLPASLAGMRRSFNGQSMHHRSLCLPKTIVLHNWRYVFAVVISIFKSFIDSGKLNPLSSHHFHSVNGINILYDKSMSNCFRLMSRKTEKRYDPSHLVMILWFNSDSNWKIESTEYRTHSWAYQIHNSGL